LAKLDGMLRALATKGAEELRLADGERPVFRFADGDRPVSQVALNRSQIVTLLAEISGPDAGTRLQAGESLTFAYRMADGGAFDCRVDFDHGAFQACLVPRDGNGANQAGAASQAHVAAGSARETTTSMDAYLRRMVELKASDLHLSAGETPMLRVDGEMTRMAGGSPLSPEQTHRLVAEVLPPPNEREFAETHDTDFAYEIPGLARFRANVFADRKGVGAVFRTIPTQVPTHKDLGLPEVALELCRLTKGLVLVTGPTGSGKSTTLAAMVDYVNDTRTDHIITIEDPIEFVHPNKSCLVNQREVGSHTQGFKRALRAALREDPDIVLVGEMRDLETIAIAIETAETGHLVFGTLHTTTAASTVDRIIDQFPADRQGQIRTMLSESLKGVISQTLLRRIGGGRIAAMEILIGIPAISNLIREGKTYQIASIMQTGKKYGMVLLNDALLDLVRRKQVEPLEAYHKAVDKSGLASQLRAAGFTLPGGAGS
jgi:twitching motility protein PilT